MNADYHEGLELLLKRLGQLGATILEISVISSVALKLGPEHRRLDLGFPLRIDTSTDVKALRLDITRAQKPVARRSGVLPDGGNDQKRICLKVELDDAFISPEELGRLLVAGSP